MPIETQQNTPNYRQKTLLQKNEDKTHFLSFLQLVLKAVFVLLLFLPGMFNINHTYSNHTTLTSDTEIIPISFLRYSLANLVTPSDEPSVSIGLAEILFYIISSFIVIEFIFSIIRAIKPSFASKGKWQIILPVAILVLFVVSSLAYNWDRSNGMEMLVADVYDADTNSYYTQTRYDWDGSTPYFGENIIVKSAITHSNTVSIDNLFYIAIAFLVVIIAIDFYIIINSSKNKAKNSNTENHTTNNVQETISQPQSVINISYTAELEKLKELLDKGIITKEEFEAKKKQLLGL